MEGNVIEIVEWFGSDHGHEKRNKCWFHCAITINLWLFISFLKLFLSPVQNLCLWCAIISFPCIGSCPIWSIGTKSIYLILVSSSSSSSSTTIMIIECLVRLLIRTVNDWDNQHLYIFFYDLRTSSISYPPPTHCIYFWILSMFSSILLIVYGCHRNNRPLAHTFDVWSILLYIDWIECWRCFGVGVLNRPYKVSLSLSYPSRLCSCSYESCDDDDDWIINQYNRHQYTPIHMIKFDSIFHLFLLFHLANHHSDTTTKPNLLSIERHRSFLHSHLFTFCSIVIKSFFFSLLCAYNFVFTGTGNVHIIYIYYYYYYHHTCPIYIKNANSSWWCKVFRKLFILSFLSSIRFISIVQIVRTCRSIDGSTQLFYIY